MEGICKLCLELTDLRHSHIVPEWCYKTAYDEKHRSKVKSTALSKRTLPEWTTDWLQKGWREPLLCKECETLFSKWERWFARFWSSWPGWNERLLPENRGATTDFCVIDGLDYRSFRLFHLSILWRGRGASKDQFSNISLGPHDEKIRKMLLSADPGPPHLYPIFGTMLTGVDGSPQRMRGCMMSPERARFCGVHLYFWVYAGCEWLFVIAERPSQLQEPLATVVQEMTVHPGQASLVLWVQPHINSNTLKVCCEKRGTPERPPLLPPVLSA